APRPLSGANSAHAQPAVPGDATGVVDCTGLEALASAMRKMTSQQILLIPGHSSGATQLEASLLPPDVAVELEFTSRFGPDVSKSGGVRQLLPGVTPTLGRHSFLKETDWERDPAALKTLLQPTSEFKTLLIGRT